MHKNHKHINMDNVVALFLARVSFAMLMLEPAALEMSRVRLKASATAVARDGLHGGRAAVAEHSQ